MENQNKYIEFLKMENEKYDILNGSRKKYFVLTYGCQMNEHDSEKMESILEEIGYERGNSKEEADIILINTCLIRENAELKVYGKIGELKVLKKTNPNLILGVCGCMMQKEEVRKIVEKKYPFVDLVFGTHNIHQIPELLNTIYRENKRVINVWENEGEIVESLTRKRKNSFKGLVNITYGCNNFCTYCVVPYTRGREKSRKKEDILNEIEDLYNNGCKEITLLGQNVNSYGKNLDSPVSFAQLLRDIDKIGIERVRFMTSHPKDLSDELIEAIRECDSLCEHIHLPFQAGNNKVLKEMNRKYTKESYIELVRKIKDRIPEVSLTTDIIVGFPGETDEDFKDTIDLLKEVGFDSAFTYLYSSREGTPAAKREDQTSKEDKDKRFRELTEVLNEISNKKNREMIGQVHSVLVEGFSKNNKEALTGRTRTSKIVNFKGGERLIGEIINIKIIDAKTWSLEGEVL